MSVKVTKAKDPSVQSIAKKGVVIKGPTGELKGIIEAISKQKGDQVVTSGSRIPTVGRIPTGVFEFDFSTGGGFPRSRYSIVYGPESSGKTNICYAAAARAQKMPAPCNKVVWIDLEGTFDPVWAALFGIDVDELLVVKPSYGEEAVDLIDALVRAQEVILLVVDSLAVVVSSKEVEQSVEKFDVGTAAVLVKRMCNKLVIALAEEARRGHSPAVVLINQTRFKIGVMFGDPETMPGGQTMKFLSSLTVRLYGKNKIDKAITPDLPAYKDTKAVIKKAKIAVVRQDFDYEMSMLPAAGNGVGSSQSWNMVSGYLKDLGYLSKLEKGSGWQLLGEEFPTLVPIRDRYENDTNFADSLHKIIIEAHTSHYKLIEAEGAAGG